MVVHLLLEVHRSGVAKRAIWVAMGPTTWLDDVDITISGCDAEGTTTYLNARAAKAFDSTGGYDLIGKKMADCHPGASRERFLALLSSQEQQAYTIEKQGKRRLIYQSPVFHEGKFAGYVELSLPLPDTLPHFRRD
jgi:transcriptional regulator with PAS, ATPase and Fis domain